jgi:hypothetical protein
VQLCKKESERERSVYWHGMAQAGCSRQQGTESSLVSHSLLCFSAASLLHLSSLVMDGSLPPCPRCLCLLLLALPSL